MAVAVRTGQGYRNHRNQVVRPDGSRITALMNIELLKDHDGHVIGAVNICQESALYKPRMPFEGMASPLVAILKALPAAIYTTDAAGRIILQ